jgi:hypothetical protein
MTVRDLTFEQWQDRIVWLRDTMPNELETALWNAEAEANNARLIMLLDEIKSAAQQCAKHIRDKAEVDPYQRSADA